MPTGRPARRRPLPPPQTPGLQEGPAAGPPSWARLRSWVGGRVGARRSASECVGVRRSAFSDTRCWVEKGRRARKIKDLDKIDYKKFNQRMTSKLETISDVHLELDVRRESGPAIIKESMSCPGALHHDASRCMRLVPTQVFSEARGPPSTSVRVALHAVTAMFHCVSLFNKIWI